MVRVESMMNVDEKMVALEAKPIHGRVEPTPEMVAAFEARFGLTLPESYRAFLMRHGAMHVDGAVDFKEPTPIGPTVAVAKFFGFETESKTSTDIAWATHIAEGHGVAIPIAESSPGGWFFLVCTGDNEGCVFLSDYEERHEWTDATFLKRFPMLDPAIAGYLAMRRDGTLPPLRSGTRGWYLVGNSFSEFLEGCAKPAVSAS